jgi:hypothetical protein
MPAAERYCLPKVESLQKAVAEGSILAARALRAKFKCYWVQHRVRLARIRAAAL